MMTDDSLHGRTVLTSDGHALGELTHILVDNKLMPAAVEVKVRREVAERLHLPHTRLRAPTLQIPAESVHSIADVIILEVGLESLSARAPARTEPAPVRRTEPAPVRH
jgi:sporulation protein YlmC with PRC-barrel domain